LIENNARVGAEVALEMAKIRQSSNGHASSSNYFGSGHELKAATKEIESRTLAANHPQTPLVQVFGSAAIDITTRPSIPLQPGTTTPGSIILTPGGVGRNIAEAAQCLLPPGSVQLVSMVGLDTSSPGNGVDGFGKVLKLEMEGSGMRVDGLIEKEGRTAGCTLSLGMEGDLNDGVADMGIIEGLTPDLVSHSLSKKKKLKRKVEQAIRKETPKMVVFDCNILPASIEVLLNTCQELDIPCKSRSSPAYGVRSPSLR
jgi:pseudouridine-5'-phosphate glycosidase/pseudouridine kinase